MIDFEQTRNPLCWPANWPRTAPMLRTHSRFKQPTTQGAWNFLLREMRLLATSWLMSSNLPWSNRGWPLDNKRPQADPGVAVYFKFKGKPHSLACDKWLRVEDNIWAIAKHVEALRGQDRWGVGTLEQAFTGYLALPGVGESSGHHWWTVLGVPSNATHDQVKEAYRVLAKKHHPDRNGSSEMFHRINDAYEQFNRILKAA